MVGAGRFERPTPCAQGRCATRLRYAPTLLSDFIISAATPPAGIWSGWLDAALAHALETAVMPAVAEVDNQSDHQPHDQPHPIDPPQLVHHVAVEADAQHGHDRHPRRAER